MKIKAIAGVISLTLSLQIISFVFAATPPTVVKTLVKKATLSVRSKNCLVQLRSASFKTVKIRCGAASNKKKNPSSTSKIRYLLPLQSISVKSSTSKNSKCFLVAQAKNSSQVDIKCLATAPTLTPTPTQTSTNTPEFTATPTDTSTPTITPTPTTTPTANANALIESNKLVAFNTSDPVGANSAQSITGVAVGDILVAIDRRAQNGLLYGLGYNSTVGSVKLYVISTSGLVATAIGTTGTFVDGSGNPTGVGTNSFTRFCMDFNPVADRIRVSNTSGQNFRINPNTGAFLDGDLGGSSGSVTGLNMDGSINGSATIVQGCAYTNNAPDSTVTTLYTMNATTDALYIQNSPNSGTQANGVSLGDDFVEVRGFDIPSGVNATSSNTAVSSGSGYAVLEFASTSQQKFCSINLATGGVSNVMTLGSGTLNIESLALQSPSGVPIVGVVSNANQIARFNAQTPSTVVTVGVTGITAGETLVGLDFRPSTGELLTLGVNHTTDTATLYKLDPISGAASAIGSSSLIAFVNNLGNPVDFPAVTSGYGFDINPVADRVRVIVGSINFRVNPNTGAPIDGDLGGAAGSVSGTNPDGPINGSTTSVQGVAYTNSFGGASVTTLYVLDNAAAGFFLSSSPNSGTTSNFLPILLSGTSLTFSSVFSIDIPSSVTVATSGAVITSGQAYAVFTVAGVTSLFTVDLKTGAATNLGTIGTGSSSFSGIALAQTNVN